MFSVLCKESTEPEIGVTLKLGDIAVALQSDWVPLAEHLNITEPEVIKIQTDIGNIVEQASHYLRKCAMLCIFQQVLSYLQTSCAD